METKRGQLSRTAIPISVSYFHRRRRTILDLKITADAFGAIYLSLLCSFPHGLPLFLF